jgi:hypothetical protein
MTTPHLDLHRSTFTRRLKAGLITPMTPEALALVRFYIVRQANKTNQKTRRLDFPNFDNLVAALREVSTPMATATSRVVSDPVVRATSGSVMQSTTEDIRPRAVSSNPSVPSAKRQRGHGHRRDRLLSEPLSQPGIGLRWEDLPAMAGTGQMDPTSSVPKRRRTRSRSPIPERDLGNEQTSGLQELTKGPSDRRPSRLSHREAPDTVAGEAFDLNVSQRSQNSPPHEPGCSAPEVPNMIPLGPSLAEQLFPSDESEDGQVQRDSATVSEIREDRQAIPTWTDQTNLPGGSREDADQEEESASSHEDVVLASKALLEFGVTPGLLQHLPGLSQVTFSMQHDKDYLPIYLHIGTCKGRQALIYFKVPANRKVAPPMHVMLKQTVGDELEPASFVQVNEMLDESANLFDHPFSRIWNRNEFKAASKYYFVLAAEARLRGFTDLVFPLNDSFEQNLQRICERIRSNIPDVDPNADLSGNIPSSPMPPATTRQFIPKTDLSVPSAPAGGIAGNSDDDDEPPVDPIRRRPTNRPHPAVPPQKTHSGSGSRDIAQVTRCSELMKQKKHLTGRVTKNRAEATRKSSRAQEMIQQAQMLMRCASERMDTAWQLNKGCGKNQEEISLIGEELDQAGQEAYQFLLDRAGGRRS